MKAAAVTLSRPPRRALGLRARIVGVVLLTGLATLAVAAVALLGPLEHSLRNAALTTLKNDLEHFDGHSVTAKFASLDLDELPFASFAPGSFGKPSPGEMARQELMRRENIVGAQIGGSVFLFGDPEQTGDSTPLALTPTQTDEVQDSGFSDVRRAFLTERPVPSFGTINGRDYARDALPFRTQGQRYVLAVRRPIDDIAGAVHAVGRAFLYAAIAGLALTLLLAIPLSARLAYRLRALRQSALRIAEGGPGVEVPDDRTRDEIGDLARSFATMQRRLEHQEQARRAFVATASHELRTPLTSLEGMLELLDEDLQASEPDLGDARELVGSARAQSRRLSRLAADLLDLSRLDADVALRSEPVELSELSRAVLAEFRLGTSARGVQTGLDEPDAPIWALGDPGSIARILRILLDNAVRISPSGTEVTVVLVGGTRTLLRVQDQGPGVDPAEAEHIFQRFHRGRQTGGDAGFGLGLAIGRELAERMGGSLELAPPDGGGATFTLTLPAVLSAEPNPAVIGQ